MSLAEPVPTISWPRALLRTWQWGWLAAAHLIVDLILAVPYLVQLCLLITAVCLIPAFGIGVPMTAGLLWLGLPIAGFERLRVTAVSGIRMSAPAGSRVGRDWWWRLLLDARLWRVQAHLTLLTLWGLSVGVLVAALFAVAVALAALPMYAGLLPAERLALPIGPGVSAGAAPWLFGTALLVVLPLVCQALVRVDVALARWLIGPGDQEQVVELTERVNTLTETRAAAVEAGERERRRIERDLHDGPQQRLVSIAMDLGMARTKFDTDPAAVRELVEKAHASSKEAIVELRQVVRGIHPPVLTDRGLDAAMSALAARCPVPVAVTVAVPRRPDPTVEAIAYFCVSEALTNVAKHSGARSATVQVQNDDGTGLQITVADDGRGGAEPGLGTGLVGLRQRLSAVDGTLAVDSPPGGGTRLSMTLPGFTGVTTATTGTTGTVR